ncbi:MAG TPA: SUMF1/EgtB/PvdO family nonheme iron enzyme [Fimbriimonadaceae bacterium]|nr:SUMF1/EgtB/PvdO family nonheme iron enzyme [Fimbriimonadaceae bacterium]
MSQEARKAELREKLGAARQKTLWLLGQVPDEFLRRRVHSFYSPIGWHFGHIGRTEEFWVIGEALKRPVLNEGLTFLFADLPENPKDNRVNIPDRQGTLEYLTQTRHRVLEALDQADLAVDDPLIADGYGWEFALQHECQHQETIAEMLTLIHQASKPSADLIKVWPEWKAGAAEPWIDVPAGTFTMGSDDRHGYDNEKRAHQVRVDAFRVAKHPVTAFRWSEFISCGGYQNPALWSSEGWAWRCQEDAQLPEYWLNLDGRYATFNPVGLRPIHPDEPAASVSWFEAEAFANWTGARLLTEAEREYIAKGPEGRRYPWGDGPAGDSAADGQRSWDAHPVGSFPAGAFGVHDLAGVAWEWTSSRFLPYPGFEAFPYDGYSKDHMQGAHRVCRGGSWATAEPILRCSFRNWYVPSYRQGFLGLRLAKSA